MWRMLGVLGVVGLLVGCSGTGVDQYVLRDKATGEEVAKAHCFYGTRNGTNIHNCLVRAKVEEGKTNLLAEGSGTHPGYMVLTGAISGALIGTGIGVGGALAGDSVSGTVTVIGGRP